MSEAQLWEVQFKVRSRKMTEINEKHDILCAEKWFRNKLTRIFLNRLIAAGSLGGWWRRRGGKKMLHQPCRLGCTMISARLCMHIVGARVCTHALSKRSTTHFSRSSHRCCAAFFLAPRRGFCDVAKSSGMLFSKTAFLLRQAFRAIAD